MKRTRTAALVLATALAVAACGDDPASQTLGGSTTEAAPAAGESSATTEAAGSETTASTAAETDSSMAAGDEAAEGTIVDVATEAGDFTTLLAAAQAAGLVDTLNGPGPLTVFAPTDEAFAAALEDLGLTSDELLADQATLTSILTYHVVEGEVLSTDLTDGMMAPTVNGAELTIDLTDGVMVNDATVTTPDVMASNGVIHIIDGVLLPPAAS
ncbi:MAG: fasciclin domain-containing protein [Acidimicrobiales bacterium]